MHRTVRLTMAQALVRFLTVQHTERDGRRQAFFAGVFGIFGHGNVAGVGQALDQYAERIRYYQTRNEQAMVHTAAAFAKTSNRLRTIACTTSIGPGATNMVTGAAGATINRLPVLLLPGDIFANRGPAPVLQQLESTQTQDVSVNDCFRPVSRYWDRISRPEQLITALPEAMRVLTSPADTGAVTLALPQDTQAEALDYPVDLFEERVWHIARPRGDRDALARAATAIRSARKPVIIAGGGVLYSEASEALRRLAEATGIPVLETQAGKSCIPWDHPLALGAVGVSGSFAANRVAAESDLVIGVGTRFTDFTTMSKTGFTNPDVKFVTVNVAELDAFKHSAIAVVADARAALEELGSVLADYRVDDEYRRRTAALAGAWREEVERVCGEHHGPLMSQAAVIGLVNKAATPRDVVVCAAGSLPGELHKLWRSREPNTYHLEYGYSCMGYEIAGGLGVKLANPDRDVYVLVGDGSYLMMAQEIVTSIQEGYPLKIVLLDSAGFASIGSLSQSIGSKGFGTRYRYRDRSTGRLDGAALPVDFAANAQSLGAEVYHATDVPSLERALEAVRAAERTAVVYVPVDPDVRVPDYDSWWNVPVAAVSEQESVQQSRTSWETGKRRERHFL